MPFTLNQTKSPLSSRKKQKYLMVVLGLVVVLIIFMVWQGFTKKGGGAPVAGTETSATFTKVKIDWQLLENPQIEELVLFERAPSYEDEIGRENPFIP